MTQFCDMAITILSKTRDGDDLAPEHLWLLQEAVNGHLNDVGVSAFNDLHRNVVGGTYARPWLHDVEHLTRDHNGYVYWKSQEIDHWSGDLPYSERGRVQATELARRCMILESKGVPINSSTVIWRWEERS